MPEREPRYYAAPTTKGGPWEVCDMRLSCVVSRHRTEAEAEAKAARLNGGDDA